MKCLFMKKYYIKIIITFAFLLTPFLSFSMNTVSVLTWWDYLDKPWITKKIKEECHVNLSLQEYKDDNTFLRLFHQYKYDIAIFESTIFPKINSEFSKNIKSDLYDNNQNYKSFIRKKFISHINSKNTAMFYISYVTFLYNPKNISINKNDTIKSIINKLQDNKSKYPLVFLDDPNMIAQIISSDQNKDLSIKSFDKEFENYKNIIFSNDFKNYDKLGVFVNWSGEALLNQKLAKEEGIKLNIVSIQKYEYTTFDLIEQFKTSKEINCVANFISKKSTMDKLQNQVYYFSPYADYKNIDDLYFKKIYSDFVNDGKNNQLQWIFPSNDFINKTQKRWHKISLTNGL